MLLPSTPGTDRNVHHPFPGLSARLAVFQSLDEWTGLAHLHNGLETAHFDLTPTDSSSTNEVRYRQAESADVKELTKMKASCQQQSALCFVVTEPRHSEASNVQISCFGPTLSYIDKTAIPLSPIGSPAFYEIFSELLHRADSLQEECHKHRFESFDQSFAAMMEGRSNGCEYMLCEISRSCRRHRLRVPASGTKSGLWIHVGGSGQIQQGRASYDKAIICQRRLAWHWPCSAKGRNIVGDAIAVMLIKE
ncbi:hypothetical protein EDD85DRAFT_789863 [Armillaria nabsnona]|nr:hypothetical protein EDD85DRAFT_789863 [Armillaria nabsnona]